VLERGTRAEGWVGLTDGAAREVRYALTGEAASAAARFVYLHTDHLNTPRLATDDTQTVLWSWEGEAFGATTPNEDPDGDHLRLILALRFPGQYADTESGLYYNWNRYYDPGTGRYVTSDPIGIFGGLNTYVYVGSNATRWTDPLGWVICAPDEIAVADPNNPGVGFFCKPKNPNRSSGNRCVTAECSAGVLPNPSQKPITPCELKCSFVVGSVCKPIAPLGHGIRRSLHMLRAKLPLSMHAVEVAKRETSVWLIRTKLRDA
jgi:RHS repeat-associated protein